MLLNLVDILTGHRKMSFLPIYHCILIEGFKEIVLKMELSSCNSSLTGTNF